MLAVWIALVSLGLAGAGSTAQESWPVDRWLVSSPLEPGSVTLHGEDPLGGAGAVVFPERDLEVGPSYWTLVREDGSTSLDLDAGADERPFAATTLAHTYLRSSADRSLRLVVGSPSCGRVGTWLNGQRLPSLATSGAAVTHPVRLGSGWNTLLLVIETADCPRTLSAFLLPGPAGAEPPEDREGDQAELRVQASRPPGVSRGYPSGWIEVGNPSADGDITWPAERQELLAELRYEVTAWGRGTGQLVGPAEAGEPDRPTGPPSVDLTGSWEISMFTPQGRQRLVAELEMAEDGTLEGELRGSRMGGRLSDGWVSGNEFGFVVQLSAPGGRFDISYRGIAEGDALDGTVSFGGALGEFTSGFQGQRVGTGPDEEDGGEEEEARPTPGAGRPDRAPGAGGRDRPPGAEEFDAPGRDAQRELIRQRLLPPPERRPTAPTTAHIELRARGVRIEETVDGLQPSGPSSHTTPVPFDELRQVALSDDGIEVRMDWDNQKRETARSLPADHLLRALHRPIALRGWKDVARDVPYESPGAGETVGGSWRVPDQLAGFTLELRTARAPGRYTLDGRPLGDGDRLCSPCRRGERLALGAIADAAWGDVPHAVIVETGYPQAAERGDAPPAGEWLEALGKRDNRDYLELAARFAGGGSD